MLLAGAKKRLGSVGARGGRFLDGSWPACSWCWVLKELRRAVISTSTERGKVQVLRRHGVGRDGVLCGADAGGSVPECYFGRESSLGQEREGGGDTNNTRGGKEIIIKNAIIMTKKENKRARACKGRCAPEGKSSEPAKGSGGRALSRMGSWAVRASAAGRDCSEREGEGRERGSGAGKRKHLSQLLS